MAPLRRYLHRLPRPAVTRTPWAAGPALPAQVPAALHQPRSSRQARTAEEPSRSLTKGEPGNTRAERSGLRAQPRPVQPQPQPSRRAAPPPQQHQDGPPGPAAAGRTRPRFPGTPLRPAGAGTCRRHLPPVTAARRKRGLAAGGSRPAPPAAGRRPGASAAPSQRSAGTERPRPRRLLRGTRATPAGSAPRRCVPRPRVGGMSGPAFPSVGCAPRHVCALQPLRDCRPDRASLLGAASPEKSVSPCFMPVMTIRRRNTCREYNRNAAQVLSVVGNQRFVPLPQFEREKDLKINGSHGRGPGSLHNRVSTSSVHLSLIQQQSCQHNSQP